MKQVTIKFKTADAESIEEVRDFIIEEMEDFTLAFDPDSLEVTVEETSVAVELEE